MVSNDTDHHNDRDLALSAACFLSVIAVITTVANGILLVALIIDPTKKLRTPPMYLITNLALADLSIGIVVDTSYAIYSVSTYHGKPNTTAQSIRDFSSAVSVNAAMWTRVALVCERYLCIKRPFRYQCLASTRNIAIVCCLVWLYSTTFALVGTTNYTHGGNTYRLIETYANLGVPSLIIAVLFCSMYTFLKKQKYNDILRFQPWQEARRNELLTKAKQDKRMLNTVIVILVVLFLSFAPYAIVVQVNVVYPTHDSLTYDLINRFAKPLVYINSSINPFIYAWRHNVFRKSIRHVFCGSPLNNAIAIGPAILR